MAFLRSVYQGAMAAGWIFKDLRQGEGQWLPLRSLTFRRPGGRHGLVFARPDTRDINGMLALSSHANVYGLRILWMVDEMPNLVPMANKPMVPMAGEDAVVPPEGPALPVAEFVELALSGWMRFSDSRRRWVWSDPQGDPEALDPRIIQALHRKELERARSAG
ncbi:hypothetical protein ACFSM5_13810 [Lacibacterium aquatile]|uniref:Uncharacterized protein n=1 Tax=Lacibacterium aquatile TaxID=1168082 RepID=A0ABW5DTH5_9PROT